MKRLFFLTVFILMAFSQTSCEDDALNPLPTKVSGQYMRFAIKNREMDFNQLATTALTGTLSNPSGTVVKFELFVRRRDASRFLTSDYVPMLTVNTFPYELAITPQMVADAVHLNVSDLQDGDVYTFFGYSYNAAGEKSGYINLARILQVTSSMQQGYKFNTQLTSNPTPLDAVVPYDNHQTSP